MDSTSGKILVVDDNQVILDSLRQLLKYDFEKVNTISDPAKLAVIVEEGDYDVILLDMNFKPGAHTGEEGMYWINKILEIDKEAVIILITAYGDIELAVKAIRAGGIDFILKPWETQKLISTLKSAVKLRKAKLDVAKLKTKQEIFKEDIDNEFGNIIFASENIKELISTIDKVAITDANILITGEHGTGKELIAREIHKKSDRSDEIFVKVDLGSIPESLFESELFGHIKGAFTDAREERIGRFQAASGGTLFLDEIGNLNPSLQSKILSVIQNRVINKIGSHKNIPIDIRLVSATNQNLNEMVARQEFREDLLYRINTIHIHLPPLRSRIEDIPLLAEHFLKLYTDKYKKKGLSIAEDTLKELCVYSWPGNIRELKHSMERAVILANSSILRTEDFNLKTIDQKEDRKDFNLNLAEIEKEAISKALKMARGNMSQAAKYLKISRTTLYSKIEKHGL